MYLKSLALDINNSYSVIFDLSCDILSFSLCFKVYMGFFFSEKLSTLVSNMQISCFNLTIYNFCSLSDSSTLISCYAIIFSRVLTCSCVVRLYSCRVLTCCSLWALYEFTHGTYDGTSLGYLEGPDLLFFWRYVWIHTWYIWWYTARIFRRLDWRNCSRQLWGLVARCLTWISCWTFNWF